LAELTIESIYLSNIFIISKIYILQTSKSSNFSHILKYHPMLFPLHNEFLDLDGVFSDFHKEFIPKK